MAEMSGGEALVKSLVREGVDVVFGIPGIRMYGIIAALRDEPGIPMITTRHEQATTYMADGFARVSGKPGVALVVPGAGLYNAAPGLTHAYSRSSPVLLIAGQISRGAIGKNVGAVHEVMDQQSTVRPVTRWQRPSPAEAVAAARSLVAYYDIRLKEPRYAVLEAMQTGIPEDAYIVWDVTQFGLYARTHYRVNHPKTTSTPVTRSTSDTPSRRLWA